LGGVATASSAINFLRQFKVLSLSSDLIEALIICSLSKHHLTDDSDIKGIALNSPRSLMIKVVKV
jgi:hypothetical protein